MKSADGNIGLVDLLQISPLILCEFDLINGLVFLLKLLENL